jgi:hypothetical protein
VRWPPQDGQPVMCLAARTRGNALQQRTSSPSIELHNSCEAGDRSLGGMHRLANDSQFALNMRFLKGPNVELSGAKRQAAQRQE